MATFDCTLTTPEDKVFEGAVQAIVVPAEDGELGILPGHASMVASLGLGELRLVVDGGAKQSYFVEGGFVQVLGGQVTVLAASAEGSDGIDRQAEEAKLSELKSQRPGIASSFEEKDEHARAIEATKVRLKVAQRG